MSNLATIVNNILADSGIDDINVVVTTGSYSNPAWITALAWTKITGTPTTLSGYGITNAYTKTEVDTLLSAKQNTLTLTTTGTSGAATLVGATLNIPQYQAVLTNPVTGTGTANQIAYWTSTSAIGALSTATYPSLTELSYVKGVTSAIQTQIDSKQATLTLTTTGTSGAATLVGATLNIPQYQSVLTNPVTGTGTANYHAKWTSGSAIGNSLIYDDGTSLGINTTTLTKNINFAGTFRYERVYAYGNYSANFSNAGATTTAWFKLGNASPFSQTRIFYRAGSNTSEEEGEIRISNTCDRPFIEWTRNTYNYHIVEVKGRMQGSCQPCEVWVLIRYGNSYGGGNTNFQWQIHGGTDASFAVSNTTGTPGTGTNEVSVNTTSGYFYANSGDLYVANRIGIGTTSPQYDLQANGGFADGANGYVATFHSSIGATGDAYVGIGAYRSDALASGRNAYINAIAPSGGSGTLLLQTTGGNVSIGTATPGIVAKLLVEGNSIVLNTEGSNQAKSIYFRYSDGGDLRSDTYLTFSTGGSPSEKARLTAAGRYGIGTTAPAANLHVVGESAGTRGTIAEFRNSDNSQRIDIRDENGATQQPPGLYSPSAGYGLGLYAATGPLILYAGGITTTFERVRILTTGEVGINTDTPQRRLDVFSNAVTNTAVFFGASIAAGEWSGVSFGYGEKANSNYRKSALVFERVDASARGKIHILNNNAADTSSASLSDARVTILSGGNVGISTASPIEKLDVRGKVYVNNGGGLYIDPNATNTIFATIGARDLAFEVNGSNRLIIASGGTATLSSLAGTGSRIVVADASGNLSASAALSGYVTGSGTANYITKWTGGSAVGNSLIYDNGTNVGINTTTPDALFSIANTSGQLIHHVFASVTLGNNSTWYRVAQLNNNLRADIELFISTVFGGAFGSTRVRISSLARTIQAEWGNVNNGYAIRGVRLATESGVTYLEILSNETAPAVTITSSYIRGTNFTPLAFTSTLGSTATQTFLFSDYSALNGGSFVGTLEASSGYNYSIITEGSERLRVIGNGQIRFSNYTSSSSFTGTAAGLLAFTSAGNIITLSSTLFPSGSGTTNYITKWTGANSVGNSQIFDNGSNVGIFTTPQTWTTNRQTVQIGNSVVLSAGTAYYPYASFLGNNVYYDASDVARYINASGASMFYFNAHAGGNFLWNVADPGAAGSAITFRTPMALNNAGQLSIVGTSNTANNLTVVGNIRAGGSGTTGGEIIASGGLSNGNYVAMRHDDTNGYITVTRTVYDGHLILQPYANVGISTSSPAYKLDVNGVGRFLSVGIVQASSNSDTPNISFTNNGTAYTWGVVGGLLQGDGDGSLYFSTKIGALVTEKARLTSVGNFGLGTTAPNRTLTVFGTTRHERVYGYGNNVLSVANSVSYGTVWVHLGTCNPFTTDKIYYRVNTNTSEEEGEITVSSTCSLPFVQWQRNTYNAMIVQVRARMTGGCGNCQIWVQMRYGSDYIGANTTLQWQAYNGTDSGFTVVNATGTPGTGTNEKSIVGNEGYFYANSGSITVADNIGIGLTAPSAKLQIDSALGNDAIRISDTAGSVRMAIGQEASYQGNYINTRNIDMKLQTYLAGGSGGNIIFQTQDNGTASVTERMRVNTAGRVLMGTTSVVDSAQLTLRKTDGTNGGVTYTLAWFQNATGYQNGLAIKSRDNIVTLAADFSGSAGGAADLAFATNATTSGLAASEKMRLTTAGELWIGYTADQGAYLLQVNGSVYASAYFESSDIRLKDILNRYQSVDFDTIEYKWSDGRDSKLHWGYAAQEVMKFLPDAVSGSEENYYTLDYNQVHTYKIAMLEKRIAELEQQLKNK